MKILTNIHNLHSHEVDSVIIEKLAQKLWENEAKKDAQIDIILVNDNYIQQLNTKFLNEDSVTDVIAFPLTEGIDSFFEGEIYINLDRVSENSQMYDTNFDEELYRMVLHGFLHFIGYDDKCDAGKQSMTERENYYLGLARQSGYQLGQK